MKPNANPIVTMRKATRDDVPRLVELNHAAYPDLVEEGVVWEAPQLVVHQQRFAAGQLVADVEGTVAGAIATFVVPPSVDALAPHSWIGITNGGFFASHDPSGSTLYLADIYVDPGFWGRGVATSLYAAMRDLCKAFGLARVVAGGRLWGYAEVADAMSASEYVASVIAGARRDRVLDSQLRAGFMVRGLLPNYLQDDRSRHWATLLEWENPDAPRATTSSSRTRGATHAHDLGARTP